MEITKESVATLIETSFINWLKAKASDEVVGHPANPKDCLLTRFLKEQDVPVASVWLDMLYLQDGRSVDIPERINNFVYELAQKYGGFDNPVTAQVALSYWVE